MMEDCAHACEKYRLKKCVVWGGWLHEKGDRKASCRCELLMMMMMQVITCAVEPMVVREDECGKIGEW